MMIFKKGGRGEKIYMEIGRRSGNSEEVTLKYLGVTWRSNNNKDGPMT